MMQASFFKLKHMGLAILAATAFSGAQAATFAAPTSALLTLSSDITSVLSSATFAALGSASYSSSTSTLTEAFTSVTLSSSAATDLIGLTASSDGFSLTYSGTTLKFTGISYDNSTKSLSGVMTVGSTVTYSGVLLTSSSATVSEAFNATSGTGLLTTGSLYLTTASATALLSAFNYSTSSLYVGIVKGISFGTLAVDVTGAAAAVPEPATYALMGLGLVGIGAVARRRRQA